MKCHRDCTQRFVEHRRQNLEELLRHCHTGSWPAHSHSRQVHHSVQQRAPTRRRSWQELNQQVLPSQKERHTD